MGMVYYLQFRTARGLVFQEHLNAKWSDLQCIQKDTRIPFHSSKMLELAVLAYRLEWEKEVLLLAVMPGAPLSLVLAL